MVAIYQSFLATCKRCALHVLGKKGRIACFRLHQELISVASFAALLENLSENQRHIVSKRALSPRRDSP